MLYVTVSGNQFRWNGNRFRFIGMNQPYFHVQTYSQATIQDYLKKMRAKGITVLRLWCFDAGQLPSNSAGNFRYLSGGQLVWREATLANFDMILNEARKVGMKLILVLGDNTTNYNTKETYIRWNDSINGTDYYTPVSKSITSAVLANNTITATTATPHGFKVGQIVDMSGANEAEFNGNTRFVRTVPTSTTFTVARTASDATATGTMSVIRNSTYKNQNFYRDTNIIQMFDDFQYGLANRTNTINGRIWKEDDTIFSWELINEGAHDQANDPWINTDDSFNVEEVRSWVAGRCAAFKSADPNHIVGFSSLSHSWQYSSSGGDEDWVYNGSSKGIDFRIMGDITDLDYLDFHLYPTQGGGETEIHKYGIKLGYSISQRGIGFTEQIKEFISVAHSTCNKPIIIGEIGYVKQVLASTLYYPLYPRHEAFRRLFDDFFNNDGDGILLWSATTDTTANESYSIILDGLTISPTNQNTDDRPLMHLINWYNTKINDPGKRPRVT